VQYSILRYMLAAMASVVTRTSFWILTALASGRRHGYEILRETADASQGRVSLKVATLYAALDRLEADGLIRPDGEEIVAGRARRYFVITDDGVTRLSAEVELMERSTRAARAQLATHKFALVPDAGAAW